MSTNVNTLFKPIRIGNERPTTTPVNIPEIKTSLNTTASIPTTTTASTSTAPTTATTNSTTSIMTTATITPTTNATTNATTITTTTTSTAITAGLTATTVPQFSTQKTNTRYVPPVFFIGAAEDKSDLSVGSEQELIRSGSLSLGHGERRLSTVFPEDVVQEANKNQGNAVLKILLKPESSNRGLFGDGSVEKVIVSNTESKSETVQTLGSSSSSSTSNNNNSSNIIGSAVEITGYKQGTENSVRNHFSQYGTIVKHETVNGKLVVQFEESSAAALALKSDGFMCEGERIRVKLHDVIIGESSGASESGSQKLPPSKKLEIPSNLYKSANKLGSGFSGITALDKNTTSISSTDKPKEVSLYTRLLEVLLGW